MSQPLSSPQKLLKLLKTRTMSSTNTSHSNQRASKPITTIYVGNLSYQVTEGDLTEHFSASGTIESCRIVKQRFGFVEFTTERAARRAIDSFDDSRFFGRRIRVEWCKTKGNKCYRCGREGHFAQDCREEAPRRSYKGK